jgi:hypothetical protein
MQLLKATTVPRNCGLDVGAALTLMWSAPPVVV